MTAPDFLVIGNVVKDVSDGAWRPGGTVTYAATQAARLGLRTAAVTRCSIDMRPAIVLSGVSVRRVLSGETTVFQNRYLPDGRVQHVQARAAAIRARDVPAHDRKTRIVLLGPVLDEVSPAMAGLFPEALTGFCAQGLLRVVQPDGLVVRCRWNAGPLTGVDAVIVSDDDMEHDEDVLERWQREVGIIVVTEGKGGARVYNDGRWRRIAAFPHREIDPTGAGDIFATAFLIGLDETKSVAQAARFGGAAAGLSVEGEGTATVATRSQIEGVLAAHPEIELK